MIDSAGIATSSLNIHFIERILTPLHGWTTPGKGLRLAELVLERHASCSVEIGVFGGRGTLSLALAHQLQRFGAVTAIDPWKALNSLEGTNSQANNEWWASLDYENILESFLNAINQHALGPYIQVQRKSSSECIAQFQNQTIDVMHQDGNHSEEVSCIEVERWTPKIKPQGYWVSDDTNWPTIQKSLRLLEEKGFSLIEDHQSWRIYQAP